MEKAFENFEWKNEPNFTTPLSAENLNKINDGLDAVDDRVVELDERFITKLVTYPTTSASANSAFSLDHPSGTVPSGYTIVAFAVRGTGNQNCLIRAIDDLSVSAVNLSSASISATLVISYILEKE